METAFEDFQTGKCQGKSSHLAQGQKISINKPTWEFYELLKFVDVVCDDTDDTSDSLEPKPKTRKLSRQQQQNSREERKLELFSEAVRAIKEPAQLPPPKENLVANDEVAAYANYIRLTMSKFSVRNFRKAKKCIGDILYQIEESEDYDNSIAPARGPVERGYSPTLSSNYSSASGYQASQYPPVFRVVFAQCFCYVEQT